MSMSLKKYSSKDHFFTLKDHKRRSSQSRLSSIQDMASSKKLKTKTGDHLKNYLGVNIKQSVTTAASEQVLKFRTKPIIAKRKPGRIQKKEKNSLKCLAEEFKLTKDMFTILNKLGGGMQSQVYLAVHNLTGLLIVLKIFQKGFFTDSFMKEHLFKEINLHSKLDHPHICQLWGFFHDADHIYMICQPCIQGDLYSMISSVQALSSKKVARIIGQLSQAVHYLHQNNIIHRDMKPQNIVLSLGGTIKLCDFGQSVQTTQQNELRNTLCGTPLYLAPELIRQDQYDKSIDVWAIGIMTYEMLTGKIPFKIKSINDLNKIVEDEVSYEGIKSKKAIDLISKMLKKNPNERIKISNVLNHQFIKTYFEQNH